MAGQTPKLTYAQHRAIQQLIRRVGGQAKASAYIAAGKFEDGSTPRKSGVLAKPIGPKKLRSPKPYRGY
jgi:hypothetical protein